MTHWIYCLSELPSLAMRCTSSQECLFGNWCLRCCLLAVGMIYPDYKLTQG
ncbi:mCG147705 [Mus musculus]|nr:mCG147705 [Mus musculus]